MAVGEGRRLADVVDERREPDDRAPGRRRIDRSERVVPEVLALDLVLRHAALCRQRLVDPRQQPGVREQPQPDRRPLGGQQLVELGRDPLAGEMPDQLGLRLDAGQRRRLDIEPERGCQPHGPDHPERVLLEALPRLADGTQDVRPGIGRPVVRVHEPGRTGRRRHGAPRHRVAGQVATGEVGLDGVAELDAVRPPEVGVVVVGAERRDLVQVVAMPDRHGPEPVLVDRAGHELEDALGQRVGREVPVDGGPPQHGVAQRSADDVGRVATRPEGREQAVDLGRDRRLQGRREVRPVVGRGQFRPRNR